MRANRLRLKGKVSSMNLVDMNGDVHREVTITLRKADLMKLGLCGEVIIEKV